MGKHAAAFSALRHAGNACRIAQFVVTRAQQLALLHLPIKAFELGEHDGALQSIHAPAHADAGVRVAPALPVHANLAAGLRQRIVTREDGSAIAIATQRLAREKAGATESAEIATGLPLVARAQALRGVFNHRQRAMMAVACGNRVDGSHVRRLAIQAHGQDDAGARRDGGCNLRGIDQAGVGLHIHPHGLAAQQHDHFGRGGKGKRRGDDFITRAQAQRHEADEQRLSAAAYGDAMPRAGACGQGRLQLGHLRPHDVLAVIEHALHALGNAVLERHILGFEVDEIHAVPAFVSISRSFGFFQSANRPLSAFACVAEAVAGADAAAVVAPAACSVTCPPCKR